HAAAADERPAALAGRTVLLPRGAERAAPLAAALESAGARVLVSPAIERAPVEDTAPVDDALAQLADGRFAWVVVTSVNAIDELAASAARRGTTLADVAASARWAAVGPATRRALEAAGITVDLEPTENSARGLVTAFAEAAGDGAPNERVLLPQGDLAAPTMADGLRHLGYTPHVVTAYRTVAHDIAPEVVEAWRAGEVDVVVLTSGSVAREVARQLGPRDDVAAVAIGEPTARAARAVGLRLDAVADRPTDEALAATVTTVLSAPRAATAAPGADTSDREDLS
ncbi:uroporphyrinogen-III synthase, partial [Cellulosimicrobium cellulans]|uniref:uroporphyrinogen-III synthase n=1 Tax=Cellulosimicrobium cellulans TaxID=1710 RepID=UPI0009F54FF5